MAHASKTKESRINDLEEEVWTLNRKLARYESALQLIAMPKRPDGTYNRGREACEELARTTLDTLEFIR